MQLLKRSGVAAVTIAATLVATAGSAAAHGARSAVFVQTDNLAVNQIVAYDRAGDGTLTQAGTYATGGVGGQLAGSAVDHLASQGSLVLDRAARLLYAVNAGSNSVSVFAVDGDRLALRQVIGSGGRFPVSIAVHGRLVYVLNAKLGGSLRGFVRVGQQLVPLPDSDRSLGLSGDATPQFVNTPGQVVFAGQGSQLVVSTKANGSAIDVFAVHASGLLSRAPTVNPLPGAVPFAIALDRAGHLIVAEAGTDAVASFGLGAGGTLTPLGSVATGQKATCWIARVGDRFYTSNAASATLSTVQSSGGAQTLTLLGQTATDAGTVDAAPSADGHDLYVQTGAAGIVNEFAVGTGGSLTPIGSVTVPGAAGGEGIVVS
jgi:hypothetical protein